MYTSALDTHKHTHTHARARVWRVTTMPWVYHHSRRSPAVPARYSSYNLSVVHTKSNQHESAPPNSTQHAQGTPPPAKPPALFLFPFNESPLLLLQKDRPPIEVAPSGEPEVKHSFCPRLSVTYVGGPGDTPFAQLLFPFFVPRYVDVSLSFGIFERVVDLFFCFVLGRVGSELCMGAR